MKGLAGNRRILLIMAAAGLIAGCSEPTLDASNEAALKSSLDRMTARMTDSEKTNFRRDCVLVGIKSGTSDATKAAMRGEQPDPMTIYKPMHGLTAKQIHEKAEAARAEVVKRKAPAS